MQITVTGAEYAGQITTANLEELESMVWIDIQHEAIIQNDVSVYTKRTFPAGINEFSQPIIERSRPPNLPLH